MRLFPKLRVIMMSATIDNDLFRYYFAEDHIDKFIETENYYIRCLALKRSRKRRND
jgi:HrpA-like RNA helicase